MIQCLLPATPPPPDKDVSDEAGKRLFGLVLM